MNKNTQYLNVERLIQQHKLNALLLESTGIHDKKIRLDRNLYANFKNKLKNERNISFTINEHHNSLEALSNFKRTLVYQTNLDDIKRKKEERLETTQQHFKENVVQRKPFKSYIDYLKQKKEKVVKLLSKNKKYKEILDDDIDILFKKYENKILLLSSNTNAIHNNIFEECMLEKQQIDFNSPKDYWINKPNSTIEDDIFIEANKNLHPYINNTNVPSSINVKRMSFKIKEILSTNKHKSVNERKSIFYTKENRLNTEGNDITAYKIANFENIRSKKRGISLFVR